MLFKQISFYLAILGLVCAVVFSLSIRKPVSKPTYIQKPSASPFNNFIAATGIVESWNKNIPIGVPVPGLVTKIWYLPGDRVKKGEPLFQVDTRELEANLDLLKAKRDVSLAALEKLENKYQRIQSINDPRAISSDEIQTIKFDVLVAEAELTAALASIKEKETLIDTHTIRAPIDGIILDQQLRVGQYASNDSTTIIFGDIENLQINVSIDEENAVYFDADMPAVAFPKNNTKIMIPLKFKRIDPYVRPKKELTGESVEKIYTRVLHVIYDFLPPEGIHIFVGQQMDVYIERKDLASTDG